MRIPAHIAAVTLKGQDSMRPQVESAMKTTSAEAWTDSRKKEIATSTQFHMKGSVWQLRH